MPYYDMHCHLDFAPNARSAAKQIDELGVGAFAVGVLPPSKGMGGSAARSQPRPCSGDAEGSLVRWGVGLHPWWVADGRAGEAELAALLSAIDDHTYIGEVGMDFGKAHGNNREEQLHAFREMARACAARGGRVLSIHAVRSADVALDVLEDAGTLGECTCIFHWYSDSSDVLARAVKAGCYFSVGALMLASKKGREYARQIPAERLLLETDYPPKGECYEVGQMQAQLAETCATVAKLRGVDVAELAERIAATSRYLLSCNDRGGQGLAG
ncbi:MAG: TatD family hydrolase [Eggerthellaceae bacterium]|nr:TatD family hydrolase [Eggerthellaceae bacterium]